MRIIKMISKITVGVALMAIVAVPVFAAQTSADNTVTTKKTDWVTSMTATKQLNDQKTSVTLYSGVGHNNAVTYVKVGYLKDGEWARVIGGTNGITMTKNNTKTTYSLDKTVRAGNSMRIRLKLASGSNNSGFSTDKNAHAWYWY